MTHYNQPSETGQHLYGCIQRVVIALVIVAILAMSAIAVVAIKMLLES